VEELLIEAFGVQGHLVAGIAAVPVALAKGSGAGDIVGGVFREDGSRNEAEHHAEYQQVADELFHVFLPPVKNVRANGSATVCAHPTLYAQPLAHVNRISAKTANSGKWTNFGHNFVKN
jgi:hypothetical protein